MTELIPFIVSGIAIGSVYGLAGTGLVLTYKTSGIFNFGHGALATVAAYLFYWLHVELQIDWAIAAVVTVAIGGPLMGLGMELIARRLAPQRTAMKITGTVGLILLVQGLGTLLYGPDAIYMDNFLPYGQETWQVGGVYVQYRFVIITLVSLAAVAGLYALFRFARIGIAMRAVVDDPDLLELTGTSPARVRRIAWVIGSSFAALSGVLVAPLVGLEPIVLTFLVVEAFGAAAIGAFGSIPMTFLGGLAIGIASDITKNYVLDVSWLSGLPAGLPFIALFVVLLAIPKRRLLPPNRVEARPPLQWRAPVPVRTVAALVVAVPFLLVPLFAGTDLPFYTVGLTQIILFLSLGLLVRTSGQVSLGHSIFTAIGAVAFSQFAVDHHLPWLAALLLGALVAVPVGALVAIPAIRLSGMFLALATLGFALMVERLLYPLDIMFTPLVEGRAMPRPSFAETDIGFYYLVLAIVAAVVLLLAAIQSGRLGRVLRGMAEAPVAVTTAGLDTGVTKVIVFCLSAFLAAVSGILYGSSLQVASTTDPHYSAFFAVTLLAALAMAPFAAPWYAIVMGMTAIIPAYLPGADTTYVMNALFGLFAIQVAISPSPPSLPASWRAFLQRFGPREGKADKENKAIAPAAPARAAPRSADRTGLRVENLTVRFGGLTAVRSLDLTAPMGRVTGLIGPNGAGKTTTFNACTGLSRPSTGRISLNGRNLSALSPSARGRLGLGRTFQIMELCESLTVAENVELGRESGLAGANVFAQLTASPADRRGTRAAARSAMDLCGITHLAGVQAGVLSTGQRRLVELARCLAGSFDVLLLDEPSSGLDRAETAAFAEALRHVVRERGVGVLLVEHDMSLVMDVCEHIYVLDFGVLLFQGDPESVRASAQVRAAYLGSEDAAPIDLQEAAQ